MKRRLQGRCCRPVRERIYDTLDKVRFHPVVADYLSRDGVDSIRWYKDSGRELERLVARLACKPVAGRTAGGSVAICLPRKAWALLIETLRMDARSSAFDPALRRRISKALGQVREVE